MGRPRKLSDERLAEALALLKEGKHLKVVAAQFGVSKHTLWSYRKEAGQAHVPYGKQKLTEKEMPKVLQRYDEGATWPEMAKEFNVSESLLRARCREAGKKHRGPGRRCRKVTPEIIQIARDMRAAKQPWKVIGKKVGFAPKTITRRMTLLAAEAKAAGAAA
jgi:transposase